MFKKSRRTARTTKRSIWIRRRPLAVGCLLAVTSASSNTASSAATHTYAGALPEHIIFRTAQTVTPGLGGISRMDQRCQAKAQAAGLGGTWLAILSDSKQNARNRLENAGALGPFHNTNGPGQLVADDLDQLFGGLLTATVYFSEFGFSTMTDSSSWTATLADGTYAGSSYEDWTSFSGRARVGRQRSTDSQWLDWFEQSGLHSASLYCIRTDAEPTFEDPPSPEMTHTIFVTSARYNGNLGGLGGADAECQQLADQAGLGDRLWQAILSDSTTNARDRFRLRGPVFNSIGEFLADDLEDLFDGGNAWFARHDENGILKNDRLVWTGSHPNGTRYSTSGSGAFLGDWTSPFGSVAVGWTTSKEAAWLKRSLSIGNGNNFPAHLYCIDGRPVSEFRIVGTFVDGEGPLSGGSFRGSVMVDVSADQDDGAVYVVDFFDRSGGPVFALDSRVGLGGDGMFLRRRHERCPGLCWNFEFWLRSSFAAPDLEEPDADVTFWFEAGFLGEGHLFDEGFTEIEGIRVAIASSSLRSPTDF